MLHTLLHLGHATQPVGYHSTRFSREDFLLETDRVCCILSSLADLPDRLSCLILETLMGKVAGPVPRGRTPAKKCTKSGKVYFHIVESTIAEFYTDHEYDLIFGFAAPGNCMKQLT